MNFKLKGRDLLNGDIVLPEIPYATFSDEISKDAIKKLVVSLNHGSEFIKIYKEHRTNPHIENVVDMLKLMEDVYRKYDEELYALKRER
jgi:hypothetical protein